MDRAVPRQDPVALPAIQSDALTCERPFENRFLQAARAEAVSRLVHLEADAGHGFHESAVGDAPKCQDEQVG